jgi:hypothetical protein
MAFKRLVHPVRILVTGASGQGKTTEVVDLIRFWLAHQVDEIFCICPSFTVQKTFEPLDKLIPKENIFINVDSGLQIVWKKIIGTMKKNVVEEKDDRLRPLREKGFVRKFVKKPAKKYLVILDDVAATGGVKNIARTGILDQMTLLARHLSISIIGIFQQPVAASLTFRDNLEALIAFPSNRKSDLDLLVNEWNSFSSLEPKEVRQIFTTAWKSGNFLFAFNPPRQPIEYYSGYNARLRIQG